MEGHLSSDQLTNVLSEGGTLEDRRHVEACTQCADKMGQLSATLSMFRESVQGWADQKHGSIPPDAAFLPVLDRAEPSRFRFVLVTAAVVLAVIIPLYWHVPVGQRNSDVADDTLLFEKIHAGVSRAVPEAMESLVKPDDQLAQGEAR